MIKRFIILLLFTINVSTYGQPPKKIEIETIGESNKVVFKNKIISLDKNRNKVTFSEDSQYCAIFTLHEGGGLQGGYNVYNSQGRQINSILIPGENIYISNDGRFAAYNPLLSENGLPMRSTMDFYDDSANMVNVKGVFNNEIVACFLTNGFLFIIQNEENYSMRWFTKVAEVVLLDRHYQTVVRKANFKYESLLFIPPKIIENGKKIIIPIKIDKDEIINRMFDLNLNFISEKIQQ